MRKSGSRAQEAPAPPPPPNSALFETPSGNLTKKDK